MQGPETLSLRELLSKDFPPERWVIEDGILSLGGLLIVAGQPKVRKSMTLNALCLAMCTGGNLFGAHNMRSTHQNRVLVFEQELGAQEYRERWRGMAHCQSLLDNLYVRSMDFSLLLDSESVDKIAACIEEVEPQVVCFDPLTKFHQSDENSAQEMARVMRSLSIIRAKYEVSAVVLHHEAKPHEGRTGGAAGRGSSVVFADCDTWMSQKLLDEESGQCKVFFTFRRAKPMHPVVIAPNQYGIMSL